MPCRNANPDYCQCVPTQYQAILSQRSARLPQDTKIFRVIDSKADGYPDVFVDCFGERFLLSTRETQVPQHLVQQMLEVSPLIYHKKLAQDKLPPEPLTESARFAPQRFEAMEQGVRVMLDMSSGYSQGIFLDQRDNRQRVRDLCQRGMRVLNTFAYTGVFSVYAALGGATTTTLDLSSPYLEWAKENFRINGLDPQEHFFCKGDTFHWLERFKRQGRVFDGIILDPPTFSRDGRGNIFRVEEDFGRLVALAAACLAPGGWLLCSTNCRRLSLASFKHAIHSQLPAASIVSYPMPFDFPGEAYLKTLFIDLQH